MEEPTSNTVQDLPEFEGFERLVIPSQPDSQTYIPCGHGRISVIISPYGEIRRMSRHTLEEPQRITCLTSPCLTYYERDLLDVSSKLHELSQV